jgi:anti-sigma regulatory factor (Ser/Thr protein kinase)
MQLELRFSNDKKHLPSVRAFLRATLEQLPIESSAAGTFEQFVEEAARDAVDHAYPSGVGGQIWLSIEEQHGSLEIRVRDFGIPQDVDAMERELHDSAGASNRHRGLPATVADEVHWLAYGPQGKALQVVKWLHEAHIEDSASPELLKRFADDVPLASPQEYTFRRMRPDEAEQVSQLMYRTYGNTYFNEDVYYPDRVAAQNRRGIIISYVAVGADGMVAGHYALERDQPGPVVEGGQAVVDPAHRGRGLLHRMRDASLDEARRLELVGWYFDAVSIHTLTQKSDSAAGGKLTAVGLARGPKSQSVGAVAQPQRISALTYFHWLRPPTARTVYAPRRHRAIVTEIYERLGCPFEFGTDVVPTGHGTLATQFDSRAASASLLAETIGADTVGLVRQARRELVERGRVEVVYVDLPIADPATGTVADELERDGFGFLGIGPHFSPRGDLLRLAYVVEPLERDPIKTLGEPEARLVDYVLAEQKRERSAM